MIKALLKFFFVVAYSPSTYTTPISILIGKSNEELNMISKIYNLLDEEADTYEERSYLIYTENV